MIGVSRRILLVLPWLELGGADKFNLDLVGQLAARGWQTTIVTTVANAHPWHHSFAHYCRDIIDLSVYSAAEQPARLLQIALSREPNIVFLSHSRLGYALLPYLRAHLPRAAFVDYCHMEDVQAGGGMPMLSVQAAALLDLQLVSSQHLRNWMVEHGADADQVEVVTTNIDAHTWKPAPGDRSSARASLDLPASAPVVLYAARLARQKQPLLALTVMRDVLRAQPDAVFLIAGDGQFAPYVRGFIRAHRLAQNIRFLGAQPAERMRELLAASDVFFLPSVMEGISLAIYEAMAMGIVPVSADVGGQAELVTPETGILVRRGPHERSAYVQALQSLIADPKRRYALGVAARQRVESHFRLDQMGDRMAELFERAHAQRTHSRQPSAAEALASTRRAIAQAEADTAHQTQLSWPIRRWARALFWQAVERGAWWLVPALERARWDVG